MHKKVSTIIAILGLQLIVTRLPQQAQQQLSAKEKVFVIGTA